MVFSFRTPPPTRERRMDVSTRVGPPPVHRVVNVRSCLAFDRAVEAKTSLFSGLISSGTLV
jgi:hypothetical protein